MNVQLSHLLRLLRLFYQGLNLITKGLKKEIDDLDAEIRAKTAQAEETTT